MKLLASLASPYTRKVRIVLAEKKIDCDIELVDVNPAENPVNPHNPLGKIRPSSSMTARRSTIRG